MSALGELLREPQTPPQKRPFLRRAETCAQATGSPADSIREEQIQILVQQLFFRHEAGLVRNVAFAPVEASAQSASLCLDVARTLAEDSRYDVGLFDCSSDETSLQQQLQIPSPICAEITWPIAPRLWLVPRHSWKDAKVPTVTDQSLERLRDIRAEFDFSVVYCAPVSWITARIAQTCDGIVLVLTANKTRRLVAAQVRERLAAAQIPVLGTVLAERRFPVPQGLYRSL